MLCDERTSGCALELPSFSVTTTALPPPAPAPPPLPAPAPAARDDVVVECMEFGF